MMKHGEIEPADLVVFADTGDEPRAVYKWLDWLEGEIDMPLVRVQHEDGLAAAIDKACRDGSRVSSPPLFTASGGKVMRQCTWDYKVMPIRRHVRPLLEKGQRCVMIRGISWDENQRAKPSDVKYIEHEHPLCSIERPMTRNDCKRWMVAHGYTIPPRSACKRCAYRCNVEWALMRDLSPDDFEDACQSDELMRDNMPGLKERVYIHRQLVPLREADLRGDIDRGQGILPGMGWADCEGMCGV